ncbi:pimeloyl-ACP methyl ester carboxylesterase [Paenibacillus shirakamiensis]|uniref:Pimeloyl-ACP methyl ester carboxylesterase n=1 Tax=Paenibacillus shirakamiensis TaxID=1265935 RepID=A0ABS4JBE5_9BACL|nr:alpha/beta hydrolase [Paenibacillus shirakamiensis]MBP1999040.1 pimeloyl-ACP methyl ester carboxylesterase [Paenibacillus shirakamiensis]
MQSEFISRDEGFTTHFLHWTPTIASDKLPIVCIHGNLSNARMFKWMGELLSSEVSKNPRQVVAVDLRGRGDSGLPDTGCTLQHMSSDIEAVLHHLGISKAHFIAYSMGVPYTLHYALMHSTHVHGLVIGDYPTQYPKFNEEWAQRIQQSNKPYKSWNQLFTEISTIHNISREEFEYKKDEYYVEVDGIIRNRYSADLPMRIYRDSTACNVSAGLEYVQGKILIFKGTEEGSLLNEEQLQVYQAYDPALVHVSNAGHDVSEPRPHVKKALLTYFNDVI